MFLLFWLFVGSSFFLWNREILFREQNIGVWRSHRHPHCEWPAEDCASFAKAVRVTRIVGTSLSIVIWPWDVFVLWQLKAEERKKR